MNVEAAFRDPLVGKTSLNKVVWGYGLLGSLLVSAIGLFLDSGNVWVMRLYSIVGILFSVYVTVATYQCAYNCKSRAVGSFVRICAVISLVVIPVFAYLDLSGALDRAFATLIGGQLDAR